MMIVISGKKFFACSKNDQGRNSDAEIEVNEDLPALGMEVMLKKKTDLLR